MEELVLIGEMFITPEDFYYRDLKYHLGALYKYIDGTVIELRKNHDYRVEFDAAGTKMTIDILIGINYPLSRPTIFITPRPDHPWMHPRTNQVVNSPALRYYKYWEIGHNYFVLTQMIEELIWGMKQYALRFITLQEAEVCNDLRFLPIYTSRFTHLNSYMLSEMEDIIKNHAVLQRLYNVPEHKFSELYEQAVMLDERLDRMIEEKKVTGLKLELIRSLKRQMVDAIEEDVAIRNYYQEYQTVSRLYDVRMLKVYFHEAVLRNKAEFTAIAYAFLRGEVSIETFINIFGDLRATRAAKQAEEDRPCHICYRDMRLQSKRCLI